MSIVLVYPALSDAILRSSYTSSFYISFHW